VVRGVRVPLADELGRDDVELVVVTLGALTLLGRGAAGPAGMF
jgi:hypothetical protein